MQQKLWPFSPARRKARFGRDEARDVHARGPSAARIMYRDCLHVMDEIMLPENAIRAGVFICCNRYLYVILSRIYL